MSLSALLSVAHAHAGSSEWRVQLCADGVTLAVREVQSSGFEEIKVTTDSALPLEALCDAVFGRDAKAAGDFKKRVVIRETESERWTYEQVRVPLVSDRDCVMHVHRVAAPPSGRCEVQFESTSDPSYPQAPGHVRLAAVRGRWVLSPAADGHVAITYVVYSEPGGSVPAWLTRGGQRDAALSFMKTILSRAATK